MGGRWLWALLAAGVAIPTGALIAGVASPPAAQGLLYLRSGDTGKDAPTGTRATAAVAAGSARPEPATGARVSTRDGRLSFAAPRGWLYGPCPQGGDACVEIAPKRLGGGDAIDVLVSAPAPGDSSGGEGTRAELAGSPESGPGTSRLTVDQRPAVRIDLASNASVLVFGSMPARGERFLVSCRYDALESQIRQGCDQVTTSLTVAVN